MGRSNKKTARMPPGRADEPPIYSAFAADPVLSEMVQQFVSDIPNRLTWIERQLNAEEWEALKRAAHQLKGAAGSYGFDQLTPFAQRLETVIANGAPRAEIAGATRELISNCRRITANVENAAVRVRRGARE